jgi:hypothetical protein
MSVVREGVSADRVIALREIRRLLSSAVSSSTGVSKIVASGSSIHA